MRSTLVVLLFYTIQTIANPLHLHRDYLDPILHQEFSQSPNGHYKYGYESNTAIAQQVHDPDGTAKGFYSYVDDLERIQRVEYQAGHDGFKVLRNNALPVYTPEVEAARKAHMEAYLAVYRRALQEQKEVAYNRNIISTPLVHEENREQPPHNVKTYGNAQQSFQPLDAQEINLFSGKPLARIAYPSHYNVETTTTRPTYEHVETKQYILPTPTVQHYEKVWPLPPIKYRDLAIEVNGQDRYDPRAQYNHWNNFPNTLHGITRPHNLISYSDSASIIQSTTVPPSPAISYSQFDTSGLARLNNLISYSDSAQIIQSTTVPPSPAISYPHFDTAGLTAHQADLLKYSQGFSLDSPKTKSNGMLETRTTFNAENRNRFFGIDDPITKVVVTKSHVDTIPQGATSAVQKAFENALNRFKAKYNLM